jgi:hypothetical protein
MVYGQDGYRQHQKELLKKHHSINWSDWQILKNMKIMLH